MAREDAETADTRMPRLKLDELLDELQARIDEVRGTRDRLNGLLEAVVSVGRDLNLPHVLRGIVEAAVSLVDAEYGALGVIGEDQKLSAFLPIGIDDRRRERIGALPSGHGILGELIRNPQPLRLSELSEHPPRTGSRPTTRRCTPSSASPSGSATRCSATSTSPRNAERRNSTPRTRPS